MWRKRFFSSKLGNPGTIDRDPDLMPHPPASNGLSRRPNTATKGVLPVRGQGTIVVSSEATSLLLFEIKSEIHEASALYLQIGEQNCTMYFDGAVKEDIHIHFLEPETACYLRLGKLTTYWFSINKSNGVFSFGKHYINKSMTLIQAHLKVQKAEEMKWIDHEKYCWLDDLREVLVTQVLEVSSLSTMKILPLPVVMDLSPIVMPNQNISLLDLEQGTYTIPANLPEACKILCGNIEGRDIVLDTPDFPDFSQAIKRSVTKKGLLGHKALTRKAKTSENGELNANDFLNTYLHITIGYNFGDSPGIPYVLEIWPPGHCSPIHDHGDANAVIKVLHGAIQASFYNTLTSPDGPRLIGEPVLLEKDMITWIGPHNYQVHKLCNLSDDVCCTIQCYKYNKEDNVHYDKFRYVDGNAEEVKEFIPDSDMAYSDFQRKIRKEWDDRITIT